MSTYAPGLLVELALRAEEATKGIGLSGHDLVLVPEEMPESSNQTTWGVEWRRLLGRVNPTIQGIEARGCWESPFIRARCSCGWKASKSKRFTIEENAIWYWHTKHVKPLQESTEG